MKYNNICCIGGDILGRTMCIAIAYNCPEIRVIVLEDEKNMSDVNAHSISFFGPEFNKILKKCQHRNLFFSSFYESAIKEADLIFLSVKVSIRNKMDRRQVMIDFKELEEATRLIALYAESDKVLVEKSDVPVKSVEKISYILESTSKTHFQFNVLSIPSYITEVSSIEEIINPERIVIGCQYNPAGRSAARDLSEIYEHWLPKGNILIVSHWSAGLYKMVSNSFLSQKRCSLNSIMAISEETGADLPAIVNILRKDKRIGPKYLSPFVELETLQEDVLNLVYNCKLLKLPKATEYWQAVLELNEFFLDRFVERIKTVLGTVRGREISVWGFEETALKKRKSTAGEIIKWLIREESKLRIHDPELKIHKILRDIEVENFEETNRNIEGFKDLFLSIHNSYALIVLSKKEEFLQLDYSKLAKWMKRPIVIDNYRLYDKEVLEKHNIMYFTLGSIIDDDIPAEF